MLHRSRIACLRIPKFQIVAHQKDEPGLKGKPLVIVKGPVSSRSQVLICSKEASKERVYPGMKLSEARAVCADLVWCEYDELLYRALQKDLLHKLIAVSPKVSATEPGVFLLDASGMLHLGGEEKFCRRVLKLVSMAGFPDVHTGVADSAFAALVASKFKKQKHFIVPPGQSSQFLAALSVSHLPREFTLTDTLLSLGIRTMGQLLNMPVNEIVDRFGDEGLRAYELARGNDTLFPESVLPEQEFHSAIELGFPVESLQQTQFILKSMLNRLCEDLKEHSLHCHALTVFFYNDDEQFDERQIKLIRSSNSPVFLLELIKLSLESRQLTREFTGVKIVVTRFAPEDWKQSKIAIKKSSSAITREIALVPNPLMTFNREAIYSDSLSTAPGASSRRFLQEESVEVSCEAAQAPGARSASPLREQFAVSEPAISKEFAKVDSAIGAPELQDSPGKILQKTRGPRDVASAASCDEIRECAEVLCDAAIAPGEPASSRLRDEDGVIEPAITTGPFIPESGKNKKTPTKRKPSTKRTSKKSADAISEQLEITSVAIENTPGVAPGISRDASTVPSSLSSTFSSREHTGSIVHLSTYDRSDQRRAKLPSVDTTAALSSVALSSATSLTATLPSNSRVGTPLLPIVEKKVQPEIVLVDEASDEHLVIDGDNMDQSEPLALLLQRFISRFGPNSLVRSVPNDQHLPDAAGSWLPVGDAIPEGTILPLDFNFGEGTAPFACGLVLRKSSSPEPVLVEYKGHLPQAVTYRGRWYRIRELTEPEKLSGLWWENPVCKSYYVALIEAQDRPSYGRRSAQHGSTGGALQWQQECEGLLVLLVRDHSSKSWQIEGFFD